MIELLSISSIFKDSTLRQFKLSMEERLTKIEKLIEEGKKRNEEIKEEME